MSIYSDEVQAVLPEFYDNYSELITYSRPGEDDITDLEAIRSISSVEVVDVENIMSKATAESFSIKAIGIDFGSGAVDPERGDLITDDQGVEYDVNPRAQYQPNSKEWVIPVRKVNE